MRICHPSYFRVYEKDDNSWYLYKGKKFFSQSNLSLQQGHLERRYGLSLSDIVLQFFQIGRGRPGFYLANLKERQFYFCGNSPQDIQHKFRELGISPPDPTVPDSAS
jgi:hypothetical protein